MGRPTKKSKQQAEDKWKGKKVEGPSEAPKRQFPQGSREPMFVEYYSQCLASCFRDEKDLESFRKILKEPLPACFRLNGAMANFESVAHVLQDCAEKCNAEGESALELRKIEWYPNDLVWQLNLGRVELKQEKFRAFHRLLIRATEAGLLSRQELVSMIPPLLLDVKSTDRILDLCAAPGSKTTQILEFFQFAGKEAKDLALTPGGVVANELEFTRAWILSHQVSRVAVPNVLVTNHQGQFFPLLSSPQGEKLFFDKVLADVPCSGDAAIRKMPDRYRTWSPMDGVHMHPLQLSLLLRSISVTKPGGLIVYSTCSFNPLENEAVVAEAVRRANYAAPGSLELLDIHQILKGPIMRPGMTHWPVLLYSEDEQKLQQGDYFVEQNYEILKASDKPSVKKATRKSLFPPTPQEMTEQIKIQYTARLFPQDQNSGGFYIALLKKHTDSPSLHFPVGEYQPKIKNHTKVETDQTQQIDQPNNVEAEVKEIEEVTPTEETELVQEVKDEKVEKEETEVIAIEESEELKEKPDQANKKPKFLGKAEQVSFERLPKDIALKLAEEYGLSEDFPLHLLAKQSESGSKVYFLNQNLTSMLDSDIKKALIKVFFGTAVFSKALRDDKTEFLRICHQGVHIIEPFMTKNKFMVSLEDLIWILKQGSHCNFPNLRERLPGVAEQLEKGRSGSYLLVHEHPEKKWREIITVQKMKASIAIMVPKEDIEGLKLKYSIE